MANPNSRRGDFDRGRTQYPDAAQNESHRGHEFYAGGGGGEHLTNYPRRSEQDDHYYPDNRNDYRAGGNDFEQDDFGDSFRYNGPPTGYRGHGYQSHQRPTDFEPLQGDPGGRAYRQGYSGYSPQYRIDEEPGQRFRHESDWRLGADRSNTGAEYPDRFGRRDQWPIGFSGQDVGHSHSRHIDPDYHQWRSEQIRNLDRDYDDYRKERYGKFAEDFNKWRGDRTSRAQSDTGGSSDTETPSAGKAALLHPSSINPGAK